MPPLAHTAATFAGWLARLRQEAVERELEWMVCSTGTAEQAAYAEGLSPGDYLDRLEAMSEWRGCGCGGGS